jgi:hypothetical protein
MTAPAPAAAYTVTVTATTTATAAALTAQWSTFVATLDGVTTAAALFDGGVPVSLLPPPPPAVGAAQALAAAHTTAAAALRAFRSNPNDATWTAVTDALTVQDGAGRHVVTQVAQLAATVTSLRAQLGPAAPLATRTLTTPLA